MHSKSTAKFLKELPKHIDKLRLKPIENDRRKLNRRKTDK